MPESSCNSSLRSGAPALIVLSLLGDKKALLGFPEEISELARVGDETTQDNSVAAVSESYDDREHLSFVCNNAKQVISKHVNGIYQHLCCALFNANNVARLCSYENIRDDERACSSICVNLCFSIDEGCNHRNQGS